MQFQEQRLKSIQQKSNSRATGLARQCRDKMDLAVKLEQTGLLGRLVFGASESGT